MNDNTKLAGFRQGKVNASMVPSVSLSLQLAGVFFTYLLQTGLAYGACLLLSRLLQRPQQRFLLWLAFLLGSGTYWVGLIWSEFLALPQVAAGSGLPESSAPGRLHPVLIPQSWGPGILVVGELTAAAYVCAVTLLLAVAAWRHLQLRLVLRRGMEPSQGLVSLFKTICRDFRGSTSRLLVLPGLRTPATACWWRPRVLLPEVCEELGPTPQLADVLHHELVHVARRDYLWAGIGDLICRLLCFHPAVWLAKKHMRLEGELACDMAVVEARPGQRADYADSLAYFVRLRMIEEGVSVGVDFAASASTLGIRIRTILAPPQPLPWWKRTSQNVAALALVAATALLLPMLHVLLDFARPNLIEAPVEAAAQVQAIRPAPAPHHRSARRAHKLEAGSSALSQDSLTSLRARPTIRETPAYALTTGASTRPDAEPDDVDRTGWRDSSPPVRTVTSVLLATIRQIPIGRIPRGRDRDHDGD